MTTAIEHANGRIVCDHGKIWWQCESPDHSSKKPHNVEDGPEVDILCRERLLRFRERWLANRRFAYQYGHTPNFQNVEPLSTVQAKELVRKFVESFPGVKRWREHFLRIDLAAVEQRLMPKGGGVADFHTLRAAEEFGIPAEQVTKEQRAAGKALNFGESFGLGGRKDGQPGSTDNGRQRKARRPVRRAA